MVAGHASQQDEVSARTLQFVEHRDDRGQHTEDGRLVQRVASGVRELTGKLPELATIVGDGQRGEGADHAGAGVGDDDVDAPERLAGPRDGLLEIAVAGGVTRHREGPAAAGGEARGQCLQALQTPGRQHEIGALPCEFPSERDAEARRCAGDEHDAPDEAANGAEIIRDGVRDVERHEPAMPPARVRRCGSVYGDGGGGTFGGITPLGTHTQ